MEFSDSIISYYRGEKTEAIILTYSGLIVLILIYSLLARYPTDLTRGLLPPVLVFVAIAVFAGSFNIYNNNKRLKDIPLKYLENKQEFINDEFSRFEGNNGVNKWWLPLNILWTMCLLFGVAMYFLKGSYYLKGVAIGIAFLGISGLLIDGFAKERAEKYTKELYLQKLHKSLK
jgi:hypothetical protein